MASERDTSEISRQYFKEKTSFVIDSSDEGTSYEYTSYCPAVFRNIMNRHNIEVDEYLEAIRGFEHIKLVFSHGKCGNTFVVPLSDNRFVTKILRKSKIMVLLEILPDYYDHVNTHKDSLLSNLLGLHAIASNGGSTVHFVVMKNIAKSDHKFDECYDLKGTTIGRSSLKRLADNNIVLKDEDFDLSFQMDPLLCHRILEQVKYDCDFLEALGIMDYSFILSIHTEEQENEDLVGKRCTSSSSSGRRSTSDMTCSNTLGEMTINRELSLAYLCSPSQEDEESTAIICKSSVGKIGVGIRARAMRNGKNDSNSNSNSNVILNLGIVNIYERYGRTKRIEHVYKSLHHRSKSVTAVDPKTYSCRLHDFLSKVFQSQGGESMSL